MPTTNNNLKLPEIQKTRDAPFCANSAHDLLSSTSVIRCHHANVELPIKENWYKAIVNGNYNIWLGLAVELTGRHCLDTNETINRRMSQKRKKYLIN